MIIKFNKYHGTGNDFIIIDNRDNKFIASDVGLVKKLCDRHIGIGADGLILIQQHPDYDFEMRYFNADGLESTMCGNGGRCAVAYSKKIGLIDNQASFIASDGAHSAVIKDLIVRLSLKDVLAPVIVNGKNFLNTGSPHYIVTVPDVDNVNVITTGRTIRSSDEFKPGGTNVNFVEPDEENIRVRTYERGVENETLSCGTGVTAAAISSRWGTRHGNHEVEVETLGGKLYVSFDLTDSKAENIFLAGPATFVFEGSIESDNISIKP